MLLLKNYHFMMQQPPAIVIYHEHAFLASINKDINVHVNN